MHGDSVYAKTYALCMLRTSEYTYYGEYNFHIHPINTSHAASRILRFGEVKTLADVFAG